MSLSTDLFALLCIQLVLCAGLLRLAGRLPLTARAVLLLVASVVLWIPAGAAQLPLVAYVRGISSDLSISLVALAAAGAWSRLRGVPPARGRELAAVYVVLAATALFLYPLALGWGDWDAYRPGWGSPAMLGLLLLLSLACWWRGLRLLPLLVALALLAWSVGLLESTNLWDYLIDPWLAVAALFYCLKAGVTLLLRRFGRGGRAVPDAS